MSHKYTFAGTGTEKQFKFSPMENILTGLGLFKTARRDSLVTTVKAAFWAFCNSSNAVDDASAVESGVLRALHGKAMAVICGYLSSPATDFSEADYENWSFHTAVLIRDLAVLNEMLSRLVRYNDPRTLEKCRHLQLAVDWIDGQVMKCDRLFLMGRISERVSFMHRPTEAHAAAREEEKINCFHLN